MDERCVFRVEDTFSRLVAYLNDRPALLGKLSNP